MAFMPAPGKETWLAVSGLSLWFFFLGSLVVVKHVRVTPKDQPSYEIREYCFLWQDTLSYNMPLDGSWTVQTSYLYGTVDGNMAGGARGSSRCGLRAVP